MRNKVLLVSIGPPGIDNRAWLALGWLKAYTEQKSTAQDNWDIRIEVFDAKSIANRKKLVRDISEFIVQEAPAMVGFSCYLWNVAAMCDIVAVVARALPMTKILLGGPQMSERWVTHGNAKDIPAHYIVVGEGEKTFADLLSHLSSGAPKIENIKGLAFRNDIAKPFSSVQLRTPSEDFSNYPSPYRYGGIPEEEYSNPYFAGMIETQRGCTFRCSYCLYNKLVDSTIKYREINDVIKDIEYLASKNITRIHFIDANFTSKVSYTSNLMEQFLKADTKDIWLLTTTSNPGSINENLLCLYEEFIRRKSGNAVVINLGLQTTNLETLRLIRRPRNLSQVAQDFLLMVKHGCFVKLDVILGLPGDSLEDVDNTLDFCFDLFQHSESHTFTPQILNLLPGTDIVDTSEEYCIEARPPFYDTSEFAVPEVYQTGALPREDFVKAMRKTAVAFRLANGHGWAKWPHYSKTENVISVMNTDLRDQFLAAKTRLNIRNSELISLIVDKLTQYLQGTKSFFINPQFPLPEYWWLAKSFEEVTDKWFLDACTDLNRN